MRRRACSEVGKVISSERMLPRASGLCKWGNGKHWLGQCSFHRVTHQHWRSTFPFAPLYLLSVDRTDWRLFIDDSNELGVLEGRAGSELRLRVGNIGSGARIRYGQIP
jgi:hypothetical protein